MKGFEILSLRYTEHSQLRGHALIHHALCRTWRAVSPFILGPFYHVLLVDLHLGQIKYLSYCRRAGVSIMIHVYVRYRQVLRVHPPP